MNFLDLFAGIGGFRLGMEQAGHKCIGYVEIDRFARQSYKAIHNTEGEWKRHDITKVTDDDIRLLRRERGRIHCICGGFPCQAFSVAGKRGGFSDTRGTLFFQIARFAEILRPQYLLLENVAGLLNHNNGDTFEVILRTLDELGFDAEWQVLNSKHFGVPQNRERVFIVGHSRTGSSSPVFPIEGTGEQAASRLTDRDVHGIAIKEATKKGYALAELGDSVNLTMPDSETRRGRVGKQIANTLDTGCQQGVVLGTISYGEWKEREDFTCLDASYYKGLDNHGARTGVKNGWRIRKLTPRECWRLQGFPDWAFDRAKVAGVSDSQLYKQAGNSVTVNVVYEIAKRLGEGTII